MGGPAAAPQNPVTPPRRRAPSARAVTAAAAAATHTPLPGLPAVPGRWSTGRLASTATVLADALDAAGARSLASAIPRRALRAAARPAVSDTGLLDPSLRAGVGLADAAGRTLRRVHSGTSGELMYWVEVAGGGEGAGALAGPSAVAAPTTPAAAAAAAATPGPPPAPLPPPATTAALAALASRVASLERSAVLAAEADAGQFQAVSLELFSLRAGVGAARGVADAAAGGVASLTAWVRGLCGGRG